MGPSQSCGGHGGEYNCDILKNGETRLQLARRVLTGGYGWNTSVIGPDGRSADARARTDGVMDAYKVSWGVTYFDGLGPRLAADPTLDADAAQKAVIDFGMAPNDHLTNPAGDPGLNSTIIPFRTTRCCSNTQATPYSAPRGLPWYNDAVGASGSGSASGSGGIASAVSSVTAAKSSSRPVV